MKRLSNILTYVLLIAIFNLIWFIIRDYSQFKELGIKTSRIFSLEQSVFFYFIIYVAALSLSIFLNKKERYILNTVISGLMAVCYIAALTLMPR